MTLAPQIVMANDTARTRLTDPLTSQLAGDRSAKNREAVKAAVLVLVRQEGSLVGSEINELYVLRAGRHGWPDVHWDTPRKRAGELAAVHRLNILNEDAPRGTEREFTLLGVRE